ncbi:MAG: dCTP deaminase [Synergistetes bacterium]|nr:dCTP deaminase [Synergistota bacterium]
MSVLPSQRIRELIRKKEIQVIPLLDEDEQIGKGSIDVRLGLDFVYFKKSNISVVDPLKVPVEKYSERLFLRPGQRLILHPKDFVLASTLEYIVFSDKVMAYVEGRSSWGRMGLIIATATVVSPGYKGIITLEISNLGDVPIALYPGMRIAQLVLHTVEEGEKWSYSHKDKYLFSLSPEPGQISKDRDWDIIRKWTKG